MRSTNGGNGSVDSIAGIAECFRDDGGDVLVSLSLCVKDSSYGVSSSWTEVVFPPPKLDGFGQRLDPLQLRCDAMEVVEGEGEGRKERPR